MSPYLLIIVQSVALPFALSGLMLWPDWHRDTHKVIGNVLIWLIAYAWIIQWPGLPPGEAVDWLWLLLVANIVAGHAAQPRTRWFFRTAVLLAAIIAIAWPVLQYQPSVAVVGELAVTVIAGGVLFSRTEHIQAAMPALTLTLQATGLAIACALSSSLLVGQLSTALAALIGAYAVSEMLYRQRQTAFGTLQQLAFIPLYLGLLAIARLYAELPLATSALLLAGLIPGILTPWRYNWAISLLLNASAIGLVLWNTDSTGYY